MGLLDSILTPIFGDPNAASRQGLERMAGFGSQQYQQGSQSMNQLAQLLMQQTQGQGPSLAGEQLKQGLARNVAAQQAFAASARPGQQGMAQRLAMQNASQAGAEMNAQMAQARLMEQEQARQQLAQLLLGKSGQDLQAAIGGYGGAGQMLTPTERALGLGAGVAGAAIAKSDRRAKKDIRSGSKDADMLLKALKAHSYRYKDEKDGKGDQLGVMAQALEKVPGGKQAVINTPHGKMVDTAKLTGALAAALGRVGERVAKLERKKVG